MPDVPTATEYLDFITSDVSAQDKSQPTGKNKGKPTDSSQNVPSTNVPSERKRSIGRDFKSPTALTYTWEDINAHGRSSLKDKKRCCMRNHVQKHILKNVTGFARPGELLAIMGSSGAGKSTLLNILTRRHLGTLSTTGIAHINGYPVDKDALKSVSAFIQQTDVFIGTLTPREHLQFQATLRMDQSISQKDRMEQVEQVIVEMGLTKCADTIIGIPGRIKGLSGGQQKRLSIASEVLTDPCILFCDEPTTGLDSYMAQSIVKSLKTLAERGKTIICTIHQPASEVFALFDRLLLMSEGRTAFLGDTQDALSFFNDVGFPAPMNYNPADHYIFTLAIRPGNEEACLKRSTVICDAFSNSEFYGDVQVGVKGKDDKVSWDLLNSRMSALKKSPYKASWWTQFTACLWRSWKTVLKDPVVLKVQFTHTVFLALVFGLVFLRQDLDQEGIQNINGFIFMIIDNLTYFSLFPVANVFWSELPVLVREHCNGTYRTECYYISKTLAELPVYIILPAIFMTIGYWMVGLHSAIDRYLIAVGIAVLIANVASSFGYMISTFSSSLDMTMTVAPMAIMPFTLLGGTFLNKDSIPVYFIWLKYLSWYLHGNEALCVNQWKDVRHIKCGDVNATYCVPNGRMVLKTLNFQEGNFLLAIGVLFALLFSVRLLSYLGLWAKARNED